MRIRLENCCSDPSEWVEETIHLGVTEYTSFLNTDFQQRSTLWQGHLWSFLLPAPLANATECSYLTA